MDFSKNLRHLRKQAGLSQETLADKLGYKSFTTIQKWESGVAEPSVAVLKKLSKLFGISMDALLSGDLSLPASSVAANRIPIFGSVPAGVPMEAIEDVVDWEDIPIEWLAGDKEYFGLQVKGDSMFPKYLEGDTIIVRKESDCESGQDCVAYVNGYDATLKKVLKFPDGIMLQPLNPEYAPRMYPYENGECEVKVAGVVVEIRRKV